MSPIDSHGVSGRNNEIDGPEEIEVIDLTAIEDVHSPKLIEEVCSLILVALCIHNLTVQTRVIDRENSRLVYSTLTQHMYMFRLKEKGKRLKQKKRLCTENCGFKR